MNRILLFLLICFNVSFSQLYKNDILFEVNDSIILTEEFHRVYNKNIELIDEINQKDFESYLDLL